MRHTHCPCVPSWHSMQDEHLSHMHMASLHMHTSHMHTNMCTHTHMASLLMPPRMHTSHVHTSMCTHTHMASLHMTSLHMHMSHVHTNMCNWRVLQPTESWDRLVIELKNLLS
jgi:hypothetical protein